MWGCSGYAVVCSSARPFVFLFGLASVNTYERVYVPMHVVAYVLVYTSQYPSIYNGMRRVVVGPGSQLATRFPSPGFESRVSVWRYVVCY